MGTAELSDDIYCFSPFFLLYLSLQQTYNTICDHQNLWPQGRQNSVLNILTYCAGFTFGKVLNQVQRSSDVVPEIIVNPQNLVIFIKSVVYKFSRFWPTKWTFKRPGLPTLVRARIFAESVKKSNNHQQLIYRSIWIMLLLSILVLFFIFYSITFLITAYSIYIIFSRRSQDPTLTSYTDYTL